MLKHAVRRLSYFRNVEAAPADPILGLSVAYINDPKPKNFKINLGVGAYRDANGEPWILPSVAEAERLLQTEPCYNHEYIPITGTPDYIRLVQEFMFSNDATPNSKSLLKENRIITGQSISGTGSLRVLGEFINTKANVKNIAIPNPSWANHESIFTNAGLKVSKYSYYDPNTQGLNLEALLDDLSKLKEGDSVLLHVCCHNPTGIDPSPAQWDQILQIIAERNLLPLFDMAYQGFSKGIVEDLEVVEKVSILIKNGNLENALFAQSFAKNMGLYGQRVGSFSIITASPDEKVNVESQVKKTVRSMYSSPPSYGSKIVETIFSNKTLYSQWIEEVGVMRDRLKDMRHVLFDELKGLNCQGPSKSGPTGWEHIVEQNGMFCFTGLTPAQVAKLQEQSIYLTKNGRISIAGINENNVGRLAQEIAKVM